jgi:DNA sulfur modification protein DndB
MKAQVVHKGSLLEGDDVEAEYRARKKSRLEKSIVKGTPLPSGWKVLREFKTRTRVFKEKSIGTQLEDKVWRLFYEIGVQRLSSRGFSLVLKRRNAIEKTKQVDVLAIDNDIVFIVECKSRETLGKKSLKKDVAEFARNKNDLRTAIRRLLGVRGLQFVFIIATENIEWNENDKQDAKAERILIWDEYDLMALQKLAKLAGEGARYQIYNRVFYNKKIKGLEIRVPALRAKMGGHTYYSFVLSPHDLLKIAYVHHRAAQSSFLELADSYQRMIKRSRIRKIEQYIRDGGFFPGSIIVNFHRKLLREETLGDKAHLDQLRRNAKPVAITLPPYYGCAWIVDGQHRLYSFADLEEKYRETVPVIAFVEEEDSVEAKIFVDINKNQKSIEANLLWDLFEDLYARSEDEKEQQLFVISKIAKLLNSSEDSPFRGHISIPKEQNYGNLTLTTICTSINQQRLISEQEGLLFHNSYEETIGYATQRISSYFDVIRQELREEWGSGNQHYVRTNAGVVVLMGILRDIVECNLSKAELEDIRKFRKKAMDFLAPLIIHFLDVDSDAIRAYRGAGGAGQKSRQVRFELTKVIRDANIGFRSIWLEKYEDALREEDRFAKRRKGMLYYLDKDESETLEFKGSLALNLNRYLLGDGKLVHDSSLPNEGVLKSIVAFLNTKGGDLLVGILELKRFEDSYEDKLSDCPIHKDKIVFGVESEYNKDEWDGYLQRLMSYIENRISPDVIDADLVKITRLFHDDGKELCLISVHPADAKQYLQNKFYIRRANKTVLLEGAEIDRYWSSRRS